MICAYYASHEVRAVGRFENQGGGGDNNQSPFERKVFFLFLEVDNPPPPACSNGPIGRLPIHS